MWWTLWAKQTRGWQQSAQDNTHRHATWKQCAVLRWLSPKTATSSASQVATTCLSKLLSTQRWGLMAR